MTNLEWMDMLRVIPEVDQNTLVLVLQNGCEISVEFFFRFETNFLVLRGRVGGTTDEARAFFVPYDQMLYFRIERVTNLIDLQEMMGVTKAVAAVPVEEAADSPFLPQNRDGSSCHGRHGQSERFARPHPRCAGDPSRIQPAQYAD